MRLGKLDKRVKIQKLVSVKNEVGHTTKNDWENIAPVWASISPVSGRELMASQREIGEVTHNIRIRYRPGITNKNRLVYGVRVFDIQFVINVGEKNIALDLVCKEGVSNG